MSHQGSQGADVTDDDSRSDMRRSHSISTSLRDGSAAPASTGEDGAASGSPRGAPLGPEVVGRLLTNFRANCAALECHLVSTYKTADTAQKVLATNWRGEQAQRSIVAQQLMTDCTHLQTLILNLSQSIADMI